MVETTQQRYSIPEYNRLSELSEARFNGVKFFVRTENLTSAGPRIIIHEYLNSDVLFVEDIGQIPNRFSIDAFIHGEYWFEDYQNLLNALNETGPKVLILPTFGTIEAAYAGQYSIDHSHTNIGEVRFRLNFIVGEVEPPFVSDFNETSDIISAGDTFRSRLQEAFENLWEAYETISGITQGIYDITRAGSRIINEYRNFMQSGPLGELLNLVTIGSASIGNLVTLPEDLAAIFIAGNDQVLGAFSTISIGLENGFETAMNMTYYGSTLSTNLVDIEEGRSGQEDTNIGDFDVPLWPEDTEERRVRNNNRLLMVNMVRTNSLVLAYEQATQIEYQTDTQIDAVRSQLEAAYKQLIITDTDNTPELIQNVQEVRESINTVRTRTNNFLQQQEQQVFTVSDLNLKVPTPASVLAYRLYAEDIDSTEDLFNRSIELASLNPNQRTDLMIGDVNIFKSSS